MGSRTSVCVLILGFWGIYSWGVSAYPSQCIDKFKILRNHTMCIQNPSQKLNESERTEIEHNHNFIRGNATPPASKMLEVGYSLALEKEAQTWADTCRLTHDDPYFRFMPGRYHVGQNIYVSKTDLNWTAVIDIWVNENKTFNYNQTGNKKVDVSNYTQLVWGDTQLVGCGKQDCGKSYFYVCNYAPGMIEDQFSTPYISGSTGDGCHGKYSNTSNSLCSCAGLFCTNGAEVDLTTCKCKCVPGVQSYGGLACELTCDKDGDHADCQSMNIASCRTDRMAPFKCPWMCNVCPFSGKGYRQGSIRMPWETTITTSTPTTPIGKHASGKTNSITVGTQPTKAPSQQRDLAPGIQGSVILAATMFGLAACLMDV